MVCLGKVLALLIGANAVVKYWTRLYQNVFSVDKVQKSFIDMKTVDINSLLLKDHTVPLKRGMPWKSSCTVNRCERCC